MTMMIWQPATNKPPITSKIFLFRQLSSYNKNAIMMMMTMMNMMRIIMMKILTMMMTMMLMSGSWDKPDLWSSPPTSISSIGITMIGVFSMMMMINIIMIIP